MQVEENINVGFMRHLEYPTMILHMKVTWLENAFLLGLNCSPPTQNLFLFQKFGLLSLWACCRGQILLNGPRNSYCLVLSLLSLSPIWKLSPSRFPPSVCPLLVRTPMWNLSLPCLLKSSTGRNSQSWSTLKSEGVPGFGRRLEVLKVALELGKNAHAVLRSLHPLSLTRLLRSWVLNSAKLILRSYALMP
jgi:hypothetical protein